MPSATKERVRLPGRLRFPRSSSSLVVLVVLLVFLFLAPRTAAVVTSIPHHPCASHADATAVIEVHSVIGKFKKSEG